MRKYAIPGIVAILVLLVVAFTATPQYRALRLLSYIQPNRSLAARLLFPGRPVYTFAVEPPSENGSNAEGLIVSPSPSGTPVKAGVVLLPGTFPDAPRDPEVLALAKGLVEDGVAVYVPGIRSMFDADITDSTLEQSEQAVKWFAQSRYVRSGKVSVVGICAGASMAVLTAENTLSKPFVKIVVADDPYASLFDVLMATATGYGPDQQGFVQPFQMNPWTRWEVAHSAAYMIDDEKSRNTFLQVLGGEPSQGDPFLGLRAAAPPAGLSPSAMAWWRLFADSSASDFESYYVALPAAVQERLGAISPETNIGQVSVPVYVIAPTRDTAYPQQEVVRLQQGSPRWMDVIMTPAIDHVVPQIDSLGDFWALLKFAIKVVNAITH